MSQKPPPYSGAAPPQTSETPDFAFVGTAAPSFLCFCTGKKLHTNSWEASCLTQDRTTKFRTIFWKDCVPLQTLLLLHTTALAGKKNAHMAYKRKNCLNTYFISKVQPTQQGNKIQKTKDWSFGTVITVSFIPLVWGFFSTDVLYTQLFSCYFSFSKKGCTGSSDTRQSAVG